MPGVSASKFALASADFGRSLPPLLRCSESHVTRLGSIGIDSKYDACHITPVMSTSPNRKEQSHERIVDVAARAIRRAGYSGVGVADVMNEAGLTHGGFYAHFASRDALLIEAMQRAGHDNQAALTEVIDRRMARGQSRFSALVCAYLHEKHLDSEQGCVVAALASEMTRQHDPVHDEARRRVAALVEFVRSALPDGIDPGQAEVVTATMVGALQLARTLGGKAGRALLSQTREALTQKYLPNPDH